MPTLHIRALIRDLVATLSIQLPASVPGEAVDDGPGISAPATHVGGLEGVSGVWLQVGLGLQFRAFRDRISEWMISLSHSLCHSEL